MSKQVTISGTTYTLNQQGDSPPWGEDLSSLLEALVEVANSVVGTGDILTTSFSVANNISSATNITGLVFDPAQIRSAIISYSVYRSTNSTELSEAGQIMVTYKSTANSWELARYSVGDAGLTFTMLPSGQMQFTSTNMSGTGYSGLLKFNAKAFTQT